jgi:hypothetical protein
MRPLAIRVLLPMLGTLAFTGCTDLQSADLKTAGMSAHMYVTDYGSGQTVASAQLNVDTNLTDFVTLSSGDTLVATVASQSQTMGETDVANDVSYSATFPTDEPSGTACTVALNRTSDVSAPNSTCTLPAPLTITAPAAGASYSRASGAINVTYGAGGSTDAANYSLSGSCVDGPSNVPLTGDPGTFVISAGTVTASAGAQGQTCQVTLTVSLTRTGTLDPAFGSGGQIQCVQSRTATFTSTP